MATIDTILSGLDAANQWMNVVSNNLSNLNTTGYKSREVQFEDLLSQTLQGGSAATGTSGGTAPLQVGLGAQIGAVNPNETQGALTQTGVTTDVAIQGNGFLVLSQGGNQLFSRDGALALDSSNNLVQTSTGAKVMGWIAQNGVISSQGAVVPVSLASAQQIAPTATSTMSFAGNVQAGASGGQPLVATVYDSLGNPLNLSFTLTNTGANAWSWSAALSSGGSITGGGSGTLTFSSAGVLTGQTGGPIAITPSDGGAAMSIAPSFAGVTQYAQPTTIVLNIQNGNAGGSLQDISIGANGTITGSYSNGSHQAIAQIALATFANAQGLTAAGQNQWSTSPDSGLPVITAPGSAAAGTLAGGALEQSNVDMSQSLTQIIQAQSAFQADARAITAANAMDQAAIQMVP
ncbi:MAG: flagellar hook protein FlgE [bacterium]